jgi:Ca-activated chloride channel family protein
MSDKPLLNTRENVEAAKRWLGRMSGGGGTEMMKGIYAALSPPSDPKRLRMVVFCTDGFIGNEQEILQATKTYRDRARVFGFGIGASVNRYLIEGMAAKGAAPRTWSGRTRRSSRRSSASTSASTGPCSPTSRSSSTASPSPTASPRRCPT